MDILQLILYICCVRDICVKYKIKREYQRIVRRKESDSEVEKQRAAQYAAGSLSVSLLSCAESIPG